MSKLPTMQEELMTAHEWNVIYASYVDALIPSVSRKTKDAKELALRGAVEDVAFTTMTNLFLIG